MVISDGVIKEQGTHDELIKKGGVYKTLYDLQFRSQEETILVNKLNGQLDITR